MYQYRGSPDKRPGRDKELKFDEYLKSLEASLNAKPSIYFHRWLSDERNNAEWDFMVRSLVYPDTLFFFDVVGWHPQGHSFRINTNHKDIIELLYWCKQETKRNGFKSFQAWFAYYKDDTWHYLKGTSKQPKGDIFMSKSRLKGVRTLHSVLGINPTYKEPEPEIEKEPALVPSVLHRPQYNMVRGNLSLSLDTNQDFFIRFMKFYESYCTALYGREKAYEQIKKLLINRPELVSWVK